MNPRFLSRQILLLFFLRRCNSQPDTSHAMTLTPNSTRWRFWWFLCCLSSFFFFAIAVTLSITSQGCDSFPPSHFRTRLPSHNSLRSKWRQRQVLGLYNLFP